MEYINQRIAVICNELKRASVVQKIRVNDWNYKKGNFILPEDVDAAR